LLGGGALLPSDWGTLLWVAPATALTLGVLLAGGSVIHPIPHPDTLFTPGHPGHGHLARVEIPDGDSLIPALQLWPPPAVTANGAAVCVIPGAGDAKTSFKWGLVEALLAAGFTVLLIDPPGHGDYRHRPLSLPDSLSVIPAAVGYLRGQPGVEKVGLIGISLGGALALRALVDGPEVSADALAMVATATHLSYIHWLRLRELWRTAYGSPTINLFKRMTIWQIWSSWQRAGYVSRHASTAELFAWLRPLETIGQLPAATPLLLVYSRRDGIAPPAHAEAMRRAAPPAAFIESKKASHIMVTLIPEINQQIAGWLRRELGRG
jgi:pimeloyl-ACP methyl ester carboxylesterase